jgi:hypothetical protein
MKNANLRKLRHFRKFPIFQNRSFDQLHERIAEQVRILPIIEPERHFIQIRFQMLGARLVLLSDMTDIVGYDTFQ